MTRRPVLGPLSCALFLSLSFVACGGSDEGGSTYVPGSAGGSGGSGGVGVPGGSAGGGVAGTGSSGNAAGGTAGGAGAGMVQGGANGGGASGAAGSAAGAGSSTAGASNGGTGGSGSAGAGGAAMGNGIAYGSCAMTCGLASETTCISGENVFGDFSACTQSCAQASDCPEKPASYGGSAKVGCVGGQCVLDCMGASCPAGATCNTEGGKSICVWKGKALTGGGSGGTPGGVKAFLGHWKCTGKSSFIDQSSGAESMVESITETFSIVTGQGEVFQTFVSPNTGDPKNTLLSGFCLIKYAVSGTTATLVPGQPNCEGAMPSAGHASLSGKQLSIDLDAVIEVVAKTWRVQLTCDPF